MGEKHLKKEKEALISYLFTPGENSPASFREYALPETGRAKK